MKHEQVVFSSPAFIDLMQTVLGKGLPFRFQANGFSMSPFIKNADLITILPLKSLQPKIGEIVAFINPQTQKLVVHRIIARKNDYFLINADNIPVQADLIPKKSILGSVNKIERRGKKIYLGLGPERLFIAFLSRMGLLTLIFSALRKITPPFVRY